MNMIRSTNEKQDTTESGSYWSTSTRGIRVKSFDHFKHITKQSDKELNCKTFVYKGTIDSINRQLLGYQDDTWRWSVFDMMVEGCFKNKNLVTTADEDQTDDSLLKINSLYYMIMSFRSGDKMKDPLCFNYFERGGPSVGKPRYGSFGIHPGHTRLMLGEIYRQPMYTIVYDYTNGLFKQRYRELKLWDIDDSPYFPVENRNYVFGNTKEQGYTPGTIHEACADVNGINYRELKGDDAWLTPLGRPSLYMPPRVFERTEDSVIVNGVEVLRKVREGLPNFYKYDYYWELQK